MPRSYFRTLPDLYERKAFGTSTHPPYPPAAIACFIGVLCFGEQQPERGRFKSRRLLTVLLEGPHRVGRIIARAIPFLIEQGDLIEQSDGSLSIEGWNELQEGDWQVTERMSRYRRRRGSVTLPVMPYVTVDVTMPVTTSVTAPVTGRARVEAEATAVVEAEASTARDDGVTDALDTYWQLTGSYPAGRAKTWIEELVAEFGDEAAARAIATEAPGDPKGLLGRVQSRLRHNAHEAEGAAKQREVDRLVEWNREHKLTPEQVAENKRRTDELLQSWIPADMKADAARQLAKLRERRTKAAM